MENRDIHKIKKYRIRKKLRLSTAVKPVLIKSNPKALICPTMLFSPNKLSNSCLRTFRFSALSLSSSSSSASCSLFSTSSMYFFRIMNNLKAVSIINPNLSFSFSFRTLGSISDFYKKIQ